MPHSQRSTRNEKGRRVCPYCGREIGHKPGLATCRNHKDLPALEPFDDRYTLTEQE